MRSSFLVVGIRFSPKQPVGVSCLPNIRAGSSGKAAWTVHELQCYTTGMPTFADMKTWTDRLGHTSLRTFTDEHGQFWLEQNKAKNSKWAKLARKGREMAWEFAKPGGAYTGRLLIDGAIYTSAEATKKFLPPARKATK